jgi:hypothetical protein
MGPTRLDEPTCVSIAVGIAMLCMGSMMLGHARVVYSTPGEVGMHCGGGHKHSNPRPSCNVVNLLGPTCYRVNMLT